MLDGVGDVWCHLAEFVIRLARAAVKSVHDTLPGQLPIAAEVRCGEAYVRYCSTCVANTASQHRPSSVTGD